MHVLVHDHTNDKVQVANIPRVQCSTNISKCIMLSTGQLIINRFECERVIVLLLFMVASVCVRVKAALGVRILVTQVTIESERCEGHFTVGSQANITHNISK